MATVSRFPGSRCEFHVAGELEAYTEAIVAERGTATGDVVNAPVSGTVASPPRSGRTGVGTKLANLRSYGLLPMVDSVH